MNIRVADLTGAECGDIAITAAEGGIGHWSQIKDYQYARWAPDGGENIEVDDDFVFYRIGEWFEPKHQEPQSGEERAMNAAWGELRAPGHYDFKNGHDITPRLIRRGLKLAIAETSRMDRRLPDLPFRTLISIAREDWTSEIDSGMADEIIQFGCFGEVRY
jgi:hypothetical protein